MAKTRSKRNPNDTSSAADQKPGKAIKASKKSNQDSKRTAKKRALSEDHANANNGKSEISSPEPKKTKHMEGSDLPTASKSKGAEDNSKLERVIAKYGTLPLSDTDLSDPTAPTPETILALVFHAMLTSARISHDLAYKSVKCLIEAGYHDIEALSKSSWQERTEVLTKGGYTRYREKTATALGELAGFIKEKYDGDLNNIVKQSDSSPAKIREKIKGIKGIGNVGTDIFFDTAQGIWPCLAPFIDPRSLKTADQCGLGNDVEQLWENVKKDANEMCKLAAALTTIRLEKKEKEFLEK